MELREKMLEVNFQRSKVAVLRAKVEMCDKMVEVQVCYDNFAAAKKEAEEMGCEGIKDNRRCKDDREFLACLLSYEHIPHH